jgi:hypothetical protein
MTAGRAGGHWRRRAARASENSRQPGRFTKETTAAAPEWLPLRLANAPRWQQRTRAEPRRLEIIRAV